MANLKDKILKSLKPNITLKLDTTNFKEYSISNVFYSYNFTLKMRLEPSFKSFCFKPKENCVTFIFENSPKTVLELKKFITNAISESI